MLNKKQNILIISIIAFFVILSSCSKNKNIPPNGRIEIKAEKLFLIPKIPNSHEFWIELKKINPKLKLERVGVDKIINLDSFTKDAQAYSYFSKKNKPKTFILVKFQDKVGSRNEQGILFDIESFKYDIDADEIVLEGKTDVDLTHWIVSKNLIPESVQLFFERE